MRERASELEYLQFFYHASDFGPADGDVREDLQLRFMRSTGKNIPEGYNYKQDGETTTDQ